MNIKAYAVLHNMDFWLRMLKYSGIAVSAGILLTVLLSLVIRALKKRGVKKTEKEIMEAVTDKLIYSKPVNDNPEAAEAPKAVGESKATEAAEAPGAAGESKAPEVSEAAGESKAPEASEAAGESKASEVSGVVKAAEAQTKLICPNCGAGYDEPVKFCIKCGTKLS